jgi:hypothetical protein
LPQAARCASSERLAALMLTANPAQPAAPATTSATTTPTNQDLGPILITSQYNGTPSGVPLWDNKLYHKLIK